MSSSERDFYAKADGKVELLLDDGKLVRGRFAWVGDYSVGFVPDDHYAELGLRGGRESLLMKGFIRVVNLGEEHDKKSGRPVP